MCKQPSTIDGINAKPMEQLRFRDFVRLKAGRDQFSRMKLDQLCGMVSRHDADMADAEFGDDPKLQAVCLRWILRGLEPAKAIRKVKTDAEVSDNAISARMRRPTQDLGRPSFVLADYC